MFLFSCLLYEIFCVFLTFLVTVMTSPPVVYVIDYDQSAYLQLSLKTMKTEIRNENAEDLSIT